MISQYEPVFLIAQREGPDIFNSADTPRELVTLKVQRKLVFLTVQRELIILNRVERLGILDSAEGAGIPDSAKRARIGKAEGRCVKEHLTDYPSEYSCLL